MITLVTSTFAVSVQRMHRFSVGVLALVFSSAAHAQMFVRIFTRRRRGVASIELVCKCFCVETTTRRAAVVVRSRSRLWSNNHSVAVALHTGLPESLPTLLTHAHI